MVTLITPLSPYYIIMVSLGTLAKIGIPLALLAGAVYFRKQLFGVFSEAGSSVGQSIGGSLAGLVTGIPQGAFMVGQQAGQAAAPYVEGAKDAASLFSPIAGLYNAITGGFGKPVTPAAYGESSAPIAGQSTSGNLGGSQGNYTDRTVTSYNRDYSDTATKNAQVNRVMATLPKAAPYITQKSPSSPSMTGVRSLGHAERAQIAIKAVGFSPVKSFKESLPALRSQGLNASQAYKVWSGQR